MLPEKWQSLVLRRQHERRYLSSQQVGPRIAPNHLRSHAPRSARIRNPMLYKPIMNEVEVLKQLSGRLDALADQHPIHAEALLSISVGILEFAAVLEVLAISKSDARPRPN
jgi:hypothetical protein